MEDNFEQEHYLDVVSKQRLSPDECRHILERLSMQGLIDERPTIGAISEATGVHEAKVIGLLAEVRGENWSKELDARLRPLEESAEEHAERIDSLEKARVGNPLGVAAPPISSSAGSDLLMVGSVALVLCAGIVLLANTGTRKVPQSMRGTYCSTTIDGSSDKEFCIDTEGDSWVKERGVRRELLEGEKESTAYTSFLWNYYDQKQK